MQKKYLFVAVCVFLVVGMTAILLRRGEDQSNNRRLILSLSSNNLTEVERLLALGADPNSTERVIEPTLPFCDTALVIAARKGNIAMVKLLLKFGARVSQGGGCGYTELDYAEQQGLTKMVSLLIQHGSKKNKVDMCL